MPQISKIMKIFEQTGRDTVLPRGGKKNKKLTQEQEEEICDMVDNDCTLTGNQLALMVHERFNITVSRKIIERCLREFHYSFKRVSLIPERRNSPDTIAERVR